MFTWICASANRTIKSEDFIRYVFKNKAFLFRRGFFGLPYPSVIQWTLEFALLPKPTSSNPLILDFFSVPIPASSKGRTSSGWRCMIKAVSISSAWSPLSSNRLILSKAWNLHVEKHQVSGKLQTQFRKLVLANHCPMVCDDQKLLIPLRIQHCFKNLEV